MENPFEMFEKAGKMVEGVNKLQMLNLAIALTNMSFMHKKPPKIIVGRLKETLEELKKLKGV